jgi:hypothetical protein
MNNACRWPLAGSLMKLLTLLQKQKAKLCCCYLLVNEKVWFIFKDSKINWVFCFQHFVFPVKINLCCHVYEYKCTLRRMSNWNSRIEYEFQVFSTGVFMQTVESTKNRIFRTALKTDWKSLFPHQKINETNTFLALTYSKIKIFSKLKKQMIIFKLLSTICRTIFFKDTSKCIRKCKNTFFCDFTKVENFDKKCLTLSKKNQKSPLKHFLFGRSKSSVKGLIQV